MAFPMERLCGKTEVQSWSGLGSKSLACGAEARSWKGRPSPLAILPQEALGQGTHIILLREGPPPGVGQDVGWRAD